jgi:murein L,D-transpeptidase YcbB/YkuD
MRSVAYFVPFVLLCACSNPPSAPPPSIAEKTDSIARIFEAPEEPAVRTIDSAAVITFLQAHPDHIGDSATILGFYKRRDYHYAWFAGDTLGHAAYNFMNLITSADTAANAKAAELGQWSRELADLIARQDSTPMTDSLRAAMELALTAGFFRVADAKYSGFVRKDLRELDWYIPRRKKNYDRLLDSLVAGVNDLALIEPLHPQYARLKNVLKDYAALDTMPWPIIAWKKGTTKPDDSTKAALRHRLFLLGDLRAETDSTVSDSAFRAAVMNAQHRYGLKENGKPDGELVVELNVTPVERERQILVNMERLRWVPAEQDSDLILVNIPEFRMHVYEHDTLAWDMNVVVGATATRSAIFSGRLSQVVMAPYWSIPQSIIRDEILPAVKKNPGYLAGKNMEVVVGGNVVPSSSIDWKKYSTGVPFTIRQKPGPGNALGQVKFLFPNEYSIYFHDTPSKDRFKRDQRAFSHGCIRLSEPAKLAEYLLQEDSTWTSKKVKEAMNAKTETIVRLKHPRPVILGYFTTWVDRHGHVNFRRDVYGHDAKLAAELFAPGVGTDVAVK